MHPGAIEGKLDDIMGPQEMTWIFVSISPNFSMGLS